MPADPRVSLAYLTPGAVAERAGTSRPLLYHHWGDGTDAFRNFLDDVVAEVWRRSSVPDELAEVADAVGSDPAEQVRVLGNLEAGRLSGPRGPLVRAGQALLLDGLVDAAAVRSVTDGLAEMYRALAAAGGFVPAGGLTYAEIATAIELVCEGYWLQGNVLADRLERRFSWCSRVAGLSGGSVTPTDDWTLFAIAVDAILAALLRPVDDAERVSPPPSGAPPSRRG